MSIPSAAQIRRQFIDYFVAKCGHAFVPSSPCVPVDDPTLMFTNAGMNQFKPYFLGTEKPTHLRVANTQKCIRAGGKHNDLDDVGHDTYHHTFFEMLGNWSFGDYFKKEAIGWAWELLTKVWGVDPTRLHATYFQGDAAEGLEPDSEARDLWGKILPPERIHPGNKKDNFWEMGDTGPCGPCSEIHIDLTPDKSGGPLVNAGDARVMEIWNLVFIQFNRGNDGKLSPLPAKHVDTGMGFERITSILQGMGHGRLGNFSNYDTDVFTPIFSAIQKVTGAAAYTGLLESESQDSGLKAQVFKDIAYRVIGDHIRTLTFAMTDGAVPSNEGRGYVLRRILRRAVRYGRQYLGTREPFMCKLVTAVVDAMGEAFPELKKNPQRVADLIRDEEASFIKTLDRGIALFEEAADYASKHHHGRINGEDAFKLHDTYGFPIDLTELMAEERGMTVDIGEYERRMEEARETARGASKSFASDALFAIPERSFEFHGTTDDSPKYYSFESECVANTVLKSKPIIPGSESCWFEMDTGSFVGMAIKEGDQIGVIPDRTSFYVEQGGQIGDTGWIDGPDFQMEVLLVKRVANSIVHFGVVRKGTLRGRDKLVTRANSNRKRTMANHTSTHVLNWALREVLGSDVHQKGSLVDPDKTRFDFSHNAQLSEEELARIEGLVNEQIKADLPVYTKESDQKKAREVNTLRAVFGEKYPDVVRVVSIGAPIDDLLANPTNPKWMQFSVEFCGGTHLKSTGDARRFRLVEESAVAKGIRRVVGVTGERAQKVEDDATAIMRMLKGASESGDDALAQRIAEITAAMSQMELPVVEKAQLRTDLAHLQERAKKAAKQQSKTGTADIIAKADQLLASAPRVGATAIISADMGAAGIDQLRSACDSLRSRAGSAAILLAAENDGKVVLLAAMTADVVGRGVKAGDLIKEIAPIVGGKGGGKPDLAQGGGTDTTKIGEAVAKASQWVSAKL